MIDVADLPSDWVVWSIDQPVERLEFYDWLHEMMAMPLPAESPLPSPLSSPLAAESPPIRTPLALPRYAMARDLAGAVFPVSEAVILQEARKAGIGRKMGRAIVFSPDDVQQLYEALSPCRSRSSAGPGRRSGSSGAPSKGSALKKALALAIEESPRNSAPGARSSFSNKRSTVVALPQPSRKPR
jgi:hypothetical protein